MYYVLFPLLNSEIPPVPLWVVIVITLLGALGTFFPKIKSSIELALKGKQEVAIKKIEADSKEVAELKLAIKELETEIRVLNARITKLTKLNTTFSTAMAFMIDHYERENPDNKTIIESIKIMIKKSIENGNEPSN